MFSFACWILLLFNTYVHVVISFYVSFFLKSTNLKSLRDVCMNVYFVDMCIAGLHALYKWSHAAIECFIFQKKCFSLSFTGKLPVDSLLLEQNEDWTIYSVCSHQLVTLFQIPELCVSLAYGYITKQTYNVVFLFQKFHTRNKFA